MNNNYINVIKSKSNFKTEQTKNAKHRNKENYYFEKIGRKCKHLVKKIMMTHE